MNDAHLHLVVNHLPIIFPLVGVIVLVVGFLSKSEAVKRTAYLIFVLGAFGALAAMSTGEGAEEIIEELDKSSHDLIHEHEEIAEKLALLSYVLGVLSIAGLWASFKQKTFAKLISFAVIIVAVIVLFFAQQTGTTGGEIKHTEIRGDSDATLINQKDNSADKD
jgi:uncharacterized membrane protein